MFKKNLIIAIIISLILGFSGGYILGLKQILSKIPKDTIILKKSEVIQAWSAIATGEIIGISDRTLTLSEYGETLTIPIAEEAVITTFVLSEEENGKRRAESKIIEFKDLKVGDKVNVIFELADSELRGITVTVFP